ncbi:hypothetical protein HPB50_026598 [Hyalomma asiaticum]|uniref:Uncharacterized protein n=1 Tax=Hyalomma asiaticum TaxID=266040 RepID=A0ACB7TTR6_HYAAI|nr:hypothetical protein HPB50_026598 [Hyalomma asiaticum]
MHAHVAPTTGGDEEPPAAGAESAREVPHPATNERSFARNAAAGTNFAPPQRSTSKRRTAPLGNVAPAETTTVHMRAALAATVACLALVLVVAALVAYIQSKLHPWHQERDDGMCRKAQCRDYAQLFLVNINWTVNPCDDFEAYVCSKWKLSADPYAYGSALATYAIQEWFNVFVALIVGGSQRFAAAKKAQALLNLCLTHRSANGSSEALLRQFMLERKIPWPDDPLPNASALGVLFDLSYNWQINVWFRMALQRAPGRPLTLVISTSNFVPLWSAYKEVSVKSEGIVSYWNRFHDTFAAHQPRRSEEEIHRIENVEQEVFAELQQVIGKEAAEPGEFLLKDIANITTNLSQQRWIEELNANAAVKGGYGPSDRIVTSRVALLEAMNKLFSKFDRRSLLLHISWFFIQAFAPLVDRNLLPINPEGDSWPTIMRRRRLCSTRVEMSFKVLVRSLVVLAIFTAKSRKAISGYLGLVTQLACDKVSALPWFADESFARAASSKLQRTTAVLWPSEHLLTDEGLSAIYTNYSSNEVSMVEHWVNSMKAERALRDQPKYAEVQDYPLSFVQPLFDYDYVMNRILISAAALRLPAYSGQGTKSMLYGGLGFAYALQLVKALDHGGLRVDANGNVLADSWAPMEWNEAVANRSTLCYGSSSGKGPFPEVPALELAHAAYEMAPGDTPNPGRVTMAFNEDQVFFITVCLSLCNLSPTFGSLKGNCNKAVANFEKFAQAFKCAPQDAMNPETRCSFFN